MNSTSADKVLRALPKNGEFGAGSAIGLRYAKIRAELTDLGLYDRDSLIMLRDGAGRVVLDCYGRRVSPDVFGEIQAELAVLTSGKYSKAYSRRNRAVKASNDDRAMMFGYKVSRTESAGPGTIACLIRDRGFIVTARFPSELIAACILMEKMCKTEILSHHIGRVHHLNPVLSAVGHRVYMTKYSKKAREASEADAAAGNNNAPAEISDLALREAVIEYGKLLVENRLIQATWGNVSVRIDDDRFLITPSGVNYDLIKPEEIVEIRVDDGSYAEGLRPSSERILHRLVYKERPDIKAIIHTHSSNCQVFAACHEPLKTGGIDYPCAEYGMSGSAKLAENVAAVMANHDGCIMANHGFVAGDVSLAAALERAKQAEEAAGRILGDVSID